MGLVVAVLLAAVLRAQTAPAFEVVSIRALNPGERPGPPKIDPAIVSYPNITLKGLIMRAYEVANYQLDGPAWLDEQRGFAFLAKIPDGASKQQVPAMLQTMLADRFALMVHWDSRVQSAYALLAAKGGTRLKKSEFEAGGTASDRGPSRRVTLSQSGHFAFRTFTMPQFAMVLSSELRQPVIDMTEIEGTYDIDLDANPGDLAAFQQMSASGALVGDSFAPSIFTGLQALGLKLKSRKVPITHLVIDKLLKVPTEN